MGLDIIIKDQQGDEYNFYSKHNDLQHLSINFDVLKVKNEIDDKVFLPVKVQLFYEGLKDHGRYPYTELDIILVNHICIHPKQSKEVIEYDITK